MTPHLLIFILVKWKNFSIFKKNFDVIETNITNNVNNYNYGCDEEILNNKIYPIIKDNLIVYTNVCAYAGENVKNIDVYLD